MDSRNHSDDNISLSDKLSDSNEGIKGNCHYDRVTCTKDARSVQQDRAWKAINTTMRTIFNNIDNASESVRAFFSSIMKYPIHLVKFLIPECKCCRAHYFEKEEECLAYSSWLLGRMFYFLGRKTLSGIHQLSLDGQIKIMQLLLTLHPVLFMKLVKNYILCLQDVIEVQKGSSLQKKPFLMKRFVSKLQLIDSLELDLSPCFLEVSSGDVCIMLESYIIKILGSLVQGVSQLDPDTLVTIWTMICHLVPLGPLHIQVEVLQLAAGLLEAGGSPPHQATTSTALWQLFISYIEQLVLSELPMHNSFTNQQLENLGQSIQLVIVATEKCSHNMSHEDRQYLLTKVTNLMQGRLSRNFENQLNEAVTSLAHSLVQRNLEWQMETNRIDKTVEGFTGDGYIIPGLKYCIVRELILYLPALEELKRRKEIDSPANFDILFRLREKETQPTDVETISALEGSTTWLKLWRKLMVSIGTLEEETSVEKVIQLLRLSQSIVQCGAEANAEMEVLQLYSLERPLHRTTFYGDSFGLILQKLLALLRRTWPDNEAQVLEKVLHFVGIFVQMPEIRDADPSELKLAVGLLSLPWVRDVDCSSFLEADHPVLTLHRIYKPYLSQKLKLACVGQVSSVECHATFSWRIALLMTLVSGEDMTLAAKAVRSLPMLLSCDGAPYPQSHLVDLLYSAFQSEDMDLQTALSEVFASVVCALSGTCVTVKELHGWEMRSRLLCMKCSSEEKVYPFVRHSGAVEKFLLRAVSLARSPLAKIRRNMAQALPSLANHLVSFRKTSVINDWLSFLCDEDRQARIEFATSAKCLVFNNKWTQEKKQASEESGEEFIPLSQMDREELRASEPLLAEFCNALVQAARESLKRSDDPYQETLILTIKTIGCVALDCVVLPALMLLLPFVGNPNGSNAGLTRLCIYDVARAHNVAAKDLFVRYKPELCHLMVKLAVSGHLTSSKNFLMIITKLARLFDFEGAKQLFIKESHHLFSCLLPELVRNVRARSVLEQVAAMMGTNCKELIEMEFQHIYPHIVVYEAEEVIAECMEYMTELCTQPVASLIIRSFKMIHNELLLEFESKRDRVLESLCYLAQIDPTYKVASPRLTLEQIADFLQPRFLGVLIHFDSCLTTGQVSESVKQKALLSLPELIRLMGSRHITLVRFKVLATLRIALCLNHSNFPDLSIAAWDAFVHSLEDTSLGPLLSTIFASLLPLLDQFPDEIAAIFRFLIVDKREDLWYFFKELYFVPKHPALENVYSTIQQVAHQHGTKTFYGNLREKMTYVTHENVDVRLHALRYLKILLSSSRFQLNEATVNKEKVEPCIIEMLNILTDACHDPVDEVKLVAGECLGEIGAVDPGIIPHKKCLAGSTSFALDVEQEQFAVQAITQLARGFQKATDMRSVDAFSLAIQELLKVYQVQMDSTLWQKFPTNLQDIMKPLLKSSYKSVLKLQENYPQPIYGSKFGSSLRDWASNWALKLLSLVEDRRAQSVFTACILVFKRDLPTVLFFLPYVLLHALMSCNHQDRDAILSELAMLIDNPHPPALSPGSSLPRGDRTPLMLAVQCRATDLGLFPKSIDLADHVRCCRTAFQLTDFLARWMREFRLVCGRHSDPMKSQNYRTIHEFLSQISKLSISRGNFECQEYARALVYLEQYVKENEVELQNQLWFFEELYVHLDDPDAVAGTLAIQGHEPSLKQMARAHEVTGQFQNAAACYEQMAQEQTLSPEQVQGMVRCYLSLDQPFTSLKIAEGVIAERPERAQDIHQEYAESLWRMHKFDELERLVCSPALANSKTWGVQVGRALLHLRNANHGQLANVLTETKRAVLGSLGSMERQHGTYYHGYNDVIKLHILYELEKASEMLASVLEFAHTTSGSSPDTSDTEEPASVLVRNLLDEWRERLKVVQKCSRAMEPVLCLRRIVLELARRAIEQTGKQTCLYLLTGEIGNCWLLSAKAARKENYHQQAYIYILNAEKYKPPSLFIEKAKLYWEKGDQESSFHTLKRCLEEQFPDSHKFKDMTERKSERMLCAKAKLLIAIYNDETVKVDTDQSVQNYSSAVHACQQWEKSLVCLAQFYDRLFQTFSDEEKDARGGEMQLGMVNYFGKSLQYGNKYIYQSMPRMLTLWLDYGCRHAELVKRGEAEATQTIEVEMLTKKMTDLIGVFSDCLPPYLFFTAFSQLISRICHPKLVVLEQLKRIIINIMIAYPQHALWMLMSPFKSCYTVRVKRCQEIFQHPRVKQASLMKIISDYNSLADKLIDLTNKPVGEVETASVNSLVSLLPSLLSSVGFSEIIVPTEQYLNFVLPTGSQNNHNPFPQKLIFIKSILDEVTILPSLQKPRRITFIGSDGVLYPMMCKPKDDLRKDFRLMEFNGIVNRYLRKDPDSRQRGLHIRTYSVVPLNEECGIIEWVPNLVGLRPTLLKMYKQIEVAPNGRLMKEMLASKNESIERKRVLFAKILASHPPILSEWFLTTYPDPASWYLARTTYVRTTAVMSMVGYILGLGDRHGENILLDSSCGDAVHVDFNCLFNKGENFDWPEMVPFRLTHNMIDAMGPMGVEGPFRRACEITLRVLRAQNDTLMSVLRPFVYDPIIAWKRQPPGRKNDHVEMTNEHAVQNLNRIERRLQGVVRGVGKCYALPLSVEGQANSLILEATNTDNLSRMYVGWGAFL